jgi:serine protease Do
MEDKSAGDNATRNIFRRLSLRSKKTLLIVSFTSLILLLMVTTIISGLLILDKLNTDDRMVQRKSVVAEGEVIADIAAEISPSVVSVNTSQITSSSGGLGYFQDSQESEGAGTGIIVDQDGLILTNKHVIPEGTTRVTVTLADGTVYENVRVIGKDTLNDLALLKINKPKKLKAAKLGDSDSVRTGERVIAIGNALGQFQNTVTNGIISGVGRPIEASDGTGSSETLTNLFQTDAAINPGNSGGPLVNFNGEVIGVNTAIAQGAEGLGFSIPINEAKPIIEGAKNTGKIVRAYLGVRYMMLDENLAERLNLKVKRGAFVDRKASAVASGSPAEKAGIKPGDVITKINNITLDSRNTLSSVISRLSVGDNVSIKIIRDGKGLDLTAQLISAPVN